MRRLLPFVCVVVVVDTMLYAALTPLLPHFRREFDLSKAGVGVLAAGFAIGVLLAAVPGGIVASRFGARAAVIGGLTLVTLASVGVALADSFGLLFGARFVQGIGSSITWAGALSWLALATPSERRGRTMGTAIGAAVFGALLGPVIGAGASAIGVRAAFSTVAGVCVVLIALVFWFEPPPPERQPARAILGAFRNSEFLRGLWVTTLPALLFGTLIVLATLALDGHGFSAAEIGAVWIVATGIESAINPVLGRITDRLGPMAPIRFALAGSIVVLDRPRRDGEPVGARPARPPRRDHLRRLLRAGDDDALARGRGDRPRAGAQLRRDERGLGDRERGGPGGGRRARPAHPRRRALPRLRGTLRGDARDVPRAGRAGQLTVTTYRTAR